RPPTWEIDTLSLHDALPIWDMEGVAHHGRSRHLAERADVRQTARAVTGFEDDVAGVVAPLDAAKQLACFLERPCTTCCGRLDERSEEHTSELQSRENLVCRL